MLWESHNPLESLPPLPTESRRLIAAFLDANHDVFELASHLEQDVFDLVQQLSDPIIKAWLAAFTTLENSARRERALRTLDAALTNSADNSTLRRCASRLLRHFELTRPRACSYNMQPDRKGAAYSNHTHPPTLTPTLTPNEKSQTPTPDLSESASEGPGTPAQTPQPNHPHQPTPSRAQQLHSSITLPSHGLEGHATHGLEARATNNAIAMTSTDNQSMVRATEHTLPHEFRQHSHPASCLPRAP